VKKKKKKTGKTKAAPAKKRAPARKSAVARVRALRAEGDEHMARGRFAEADGCYAEAWTLLVHHPEVCDEYTDDQAFWLLLSGMDALYRSGGVETAFDVCVLIQRTFPRQSTGNPFFHLRAGQCAFVVNGEAEARDPASTCVDNLARALITGGIDLFSGEEPRYLALVVPHLRPPAGHASWAATSRHHGVDESCSRDKLNDAPPYLREELARKLGPGPYPPTRALEPT
jgi:hypothetical protein